MSDSEADASFSVLPARLRRRIDRAFDATAKQIGRDEEGPSRKRRKLGDNDAQASDAPVLAGGFIVEDAPAPGGFVVEDDAPEGFMVEDSREGGFIPEASSATDEDDPMDAANRIDQIPLSAIPSALQLLDLQPDDEDVLSVFRNAATGWENKHVSRPEQQDDAYLLVSRKDWRAVCAALMDVGAGNDEEQEGERAEDVEMGGDEEEEASGEEYVDSGDDSAFDENDESDDEYAEGGFVRSKSQRQKSATPRKGKKRRTAASSSLSPLGSSEDEDFEQKPKRITARQKAESRRAFALFFPDVPDVDLDKKRVMIKDIARVATLLKEKLTTEDIVEMLEAFSTSPDKSVSLGDFERMMVTAKLA